MTTKELQKRSEKAQHIRAFKIAGEPWYYVESDEGKICYKVLYLNENEYWCTCGDFARGAKMDPAFKCKHVLAVMQCETDPDTDTARVLEKKKPKLDERFIITIEGREFVTFAGLLDLAHQKGLVKIVVEPLQLPGSENGQYAVCRAQVIARSGEEYIDIGDASPANCNAKVAKHLLRMASTRSIARALRSMTNIGMTCLEELGDLNEVIGDEDGRSRRRKAVSKETPKPAEKKKEEKPARAGSAPAKQPGPEAEHKDTPLRSSRGNGDDTTTNAEAPLSEAQKRALFNLSRRRGLSTEELDRMAMESYGMAVEYLSSANASAFIRLLQQSA